MPVKTREQTEGGQRVEHDQNSNNVKGGIPYTIDNETDLSIIVPVTETH
jgi:hypothetical protein